MSEIVVKGRGIIKGRAEGEALVTKQAFMFPHGINPKTGDIVDVRHELYGENIAGKVFIFPFGKGSTTGSTWILEAIRNDKFPLAMVNKETEPIIATGVILGEMLYSRKVPVVDRPEKDVFGLVETGDWVIVDGTKGEIIIKKKK